MPNNTQKILRYNTAPISDANTTKKLAPLFIPIQYSEIRLAVIEARKAYLAASLGVTFNKIWINGINPIKTKKPLCNGGYAIPINIPERIANCQ